MKLTLACAVIIAAMTLEAATVLAVRPDECEQQRAQYPKVWNDVSREKAIFDCISHYSGALRIKIGDTDGAQRTLLSIVPLAHDGKGVLAEDPSRPVYRIWLDEEQLNRLKTGKYFATIVRNRVLAGSVAISTAIRFSSSTTRLPRRTALASAPSTISRREPARSKVTPTLAN